jgi:hypothetical protein
MSNPAILLAAKVGVFFIEDLPNYIISIPCILCKHYKIIPCLDDPAVRLAFHLDALFTTGETMRCY